MDPLGEHDPKRVGPYRLLGRLGAGGMGQVFLGADGRGELVAIKVVHPGLAHDDRFRSRFRREAEISRRVTGPWVAAVVDADPDAPTPWLATQYVRGPSLGNAVETLGPLDAGTVHVLAHGLALALTAVHQAGLVHRDLKPSNVLLGSDHPRLIDFGISRALDGTRMTTTGMVVGTPAFMSPEQITGDEAGTASDIFSLGSVLFYAATGQSPFGDHPPVVLMMRISRDEPDLDGMPDELRGPVAACLAKRPEDRPTAAELGGMLGTVVADGPSWLPAQVAALGADPDGPTMPHARTKVATELPAPAEKKPGFSRRAWFSILGSVGLTAIGGFALAATFTASRRRWTVPLPPWSEVAAVADDTTLYLYRADVDGAVLALDTATGAERWNVTGLVPPSGRDPVAMAVAGDALVIGTNTVVASLSTTTSLRRWAVQRSVDRVSSAGMAVADGVAVVTTPEGLVALDVETGSRIWTAAFDTPTGFIVNPESLGRHGNQANVAARNGMCFFMNRDGIDARDLRSGRQLWSYRPFRSSFTAKLVAVGDVLVTYEGDSVVGLHAATGRPRWNGLRELHAPVRFWDSLDLAGNIVVGYGRSDVGVVVAFDPTSGTTRWSAWDPDWDTTTRVVVADGIVCVTAFMSVTAYDVITGEQRRGFEDSYYKAIAARGRDVYLYDSRGQLDAFTIE